MHAWDSFLHLVCEPTYLMRVFLWDLWHCNKRHVWCVCLIIPRLSWVWVLPVNIEKGQRTHKWKSAFQQTFACKHWRQKKKTLFIELALDVLNYVALQCYIGEPTQLDPKTSWRYSWPNCLSLLLLGCLPPWLITILNSTDNDNTE